MKKLLLLLCLFVGNNVFSQAGWKDINQLLERPLAVVVEEPQPKLIEKWEKKGKTEEVAKLRAAIATYNKNLKDAVETFWDNKAKGVEYKTPKELANAGNKYVVIRCQTLSKNTKYIDGEFQTTKSARRMAWEMDVENYDDFFAGNSQTILCFYLSENVEEMEWSYYVPMPDVLPTKTDMVYALTIASAVAKSSIADYKGDKSDKKAATNAYVTMSQKKLKEKTLLLREDWLHDKLTKEQIAKNYPYPFEIVSKDKLDDLVMTKDPKYAYVFILPMMTSASSAPVSATASYMQYVMDVADGSMLAMSVKGGFFSAGHPYIDAKNMQDFAKVYPGAR